MLRAKHVAKWSLTKPSDCIAAYIVVGPTNLNPRFNSSFDMATDSGDVAGTSASVRGVFLGFVGANDQISDYNVPNSSCTLSVALALAIVASIFMRLRTMPSFFIKRVMSRERNWATTSGSNP